MLVILYCCAVAISECRFISVKHLIVYFNLANMFISTDQYKSEVNEKLTERLKTSYNYNLPFITGFILTCKSSNDVLLLYVISSAGA